MRNLEMALKEIPLPRGFVALVDDQDYESVAQLRWSLNERRIKDRVLRYAKTHRDGMEFKMHRLLLSAPPGIQVDHINGNGLDNRRANLRLCDQACNNRNRVGWSANRPYKNIVKCATGYAAYIKANKVYRKIGTFDTAELAAEAYNREATAAFGEFAKLIQCKA